MFDNYACRLGETLDALQSSIGIRNIVVRERFPWSWMAVLTLASAGSRST